MIRVPGGRRPGWAVVIDPGVGNGNSVEGPRPTILSVERQVRRLSLMDVPTPLEVAARVTVPKNFNGRDATARRDLASSVRNALGVMVHPESDGGAARGRAKAAVARTGARTASRARTRSWPGCDGSYAATRATAAPSARITPAGASAGGG